ncbi:hypothetical protein [Terriglobus saanensis]|uniref:NolW domain protein n=1 Tax=Terriglobus saanensis (strain ATCC BAA-1853 / DSM 23119 / SP1PR4) TaxID=401053 RepID=E8UZQ9_TERSS|nr:hypothetical protein [Terriglobus saanensis]ADV84402.1 hypothetical protein AciPR4_3650 [Terriglobus saanensis SP1PR4]
MKLAKVLLGITLTMLCTGYTVQGQTTASDARPNADSIRTFYLTNVSQVHDVTEITTALRNLLDPADKVYLVPSENAIFVKGTPAQLLIAEKLISDLDRVKKTYRLTYTITEVDGNKRVGTQHFSVIVVSGGRTTLKQGSRVPLVTGSTSSPMSSNSSQVQYVDVGLNIDASLDEYVDGIKGIRLRTKVEQSSIAEEKSSVGLQDPVIRQTLLEGTSILILDKPLVLGGLDLPGSTRHQEVEVVLELAR